jgi:hypothetical protein
MDYHTGLERAGGVQYKAIGHAAQKSRGQTAECEGEARRYQRRQNGGEDLVHSRKLTVYKSSENELLADGRYKGVDQNKIEIRDRIFVFSRYKSAQEGKAVGGGIYPAEKKVKKQGRDYRKRRGKDDKENAIGAYPSHSYIGKLLIEGPVWACQKQTEI